MTDKLMLAFVLVFLALCGWALSRNDWISASVAAFMVGYEIFVARKY